MQTYTHTPKLLTLLIALSALLLAGALWMVFAYAPEEQTMGIVQKIFYFHVSSAWVGFFAFFVTFLGSLLYLLRGQDRWDMLAVASAEIGFVFISITLVSGMLWAKPVWGAYWVWEMRLTISLIQWLMYFSYTLLRRSLGPFRRRRARQRGVRHRGLRDRAACPGSPSAGGAPSTRSSSAAPPAACRAACWPPCWSAWAPLPCCTSPSCCSACAWKNWRANAWRF